MSWAAVHSGETDELRAGDFRSVTETNKAVAETDKAVAETDKAVAETDKAVAETDKAVAETDKAVAETDKAVAETDKSIFASAASAAGMLFVDVAAPRPAARGRLSLCVDGAIERALESRGAPPSSSAKSDGREPVLRDQVGRALVSGASGLAIWFSSLEGIATSSGALDTEDSGVIRWWIAASAVAPVTVSFHAGNRKLSVYLEPRTLESILAEAAATADRTSASDGSAADEAHVDSSVGQARSEDSSDKDTSDEDSSDDTVSDAEPESARLNDHSHWNVTVAEVHVSAPEKASDESTSDPTDEEETLHDSTTGLAQSARAMAAELSDDGDNGWLKDALLDLSTPPPPRHQEIAVVRSYAARVAAVPVAALVYEDSAPPPPVMPRLELQFADPIEPLPPRRSEPEESSEPEERLDRAAPQERPELDLETRRKLEACARELEAASGPKPLTVVERLFTNAYVPLRAALDRGADLPRLRDVAYEWARSFEKSYVDGFDALRVRTKRPSMVVDVADIALRVGRLHGARSTQLLLVDAMRYDIGEAVNDKIRALVGQRAACADRFLLWSALPTTTGAQLDLIGRGPAGLRDMSPAKAEDLVVARGRKASMIRRLKAGNREVLKLDVVASRLEEPGGANPDGFDAIADEVAQRIAAHFEGLQPRTLVMIFGDHGFAVDSRDDGRPAFHEGGASPDEVLVPAYAWLVGAVH